MHHRTCPTRWAATVLDPLANGALILSLRDGTWTHLNSTAAAYWRWAVMESRTHVEAITIVADRFGVSRERLKTELDPLLRDLQHRRLITMEVSP